ncbi:hypothetical protein PQR70_03355 [Paraburkholderia madseniana]|uniref:hypothetical protein n=1 Tax=Paraburkholderia madseniana TaxID=2599607 RepID=UPI0038B6F83B
MTKKIESLPPNNTENQHFVSQKVQSLNATPSPNGEISHINAYRKSGENAISATNKGGRPIRHNLALIDLYTFDIDGKLRRNFEALFHRYESEVAQYTLSLTEKALAERDDMHEEILGIIRAKLVDFVRNPYNVRACLRMFPQMVSARFKDAHADEIHSRVLSGCNPRQDRICKILGITPQEYRKWLATIFLLLYPITEQGEPLLDMIINGIIRDKTKVSGSHILIYDEPVVLLSDRASNVALPSSANFTLEFHASSRMLITFYAIQLNTVNFRSHEPLRKEYLTSHDSGFEVRIAKNDRAFVESYNQRTVSQCREFVYGCAPTFPGISIVNA